MKRAGRASVALVVLTTAFGACEGGKASSPPTPISPTPPTPSSMTASLWGFVIDSTGMCISDATVEVVRGQARGERVAQATPCDAWSYDHGFVFSGLTLGMEMTIRASAPGWAAEEQTLLPGGSRPAVITLKKM